MNDENYAGLTSAYENKLRGLNEVLEITEKIGMLVNNSEADNIELAINDVIDEREKAIKNTLDCEAAINHYKSKLPDGLPDEKLNALTMEISKKYEIIKTADEENKEKIKEIINGLKEKIKNLSGNRVLMDKYMSVDSGGNLIKGAIYSNKK